MGILLGWWQNTKVNAELCPSNQEDHLCDVTGLLEIEYSVTLWQKCPFQKLQTMSV